MTTHTPTGAGGALSSAPRPSASRPWHVPPPWPTVTPSTPPSRDELAALVTAASERHVRRLHGAA